MMYDTLIREDDDRAWQRDGEANGWRLPKPASWPLRLWGVRHFRAGWLAWRAEEFARQCGQAGLGVGSMNQRDRWVVYAVSRGWC